MEDHALKFRPYTGAIVSHYKGSTYTILATARHTETLEELVVYRDNENRIYARPAAMFFGYIEELNCHRFNYVGREDNSPMRTKVNLSFNEITVPSERDKQFNVIIEQK
ncbi:DUF1653 domain-containing protein [Bacillus thuringiensis]|uniref:DUF1653 domain-containing protein n=1 Tax=Bacillus thuringiensis TaxID=1428 RepID=UPI002D80C699|nr:DUF1653 domain-containing protein [Bacillus thuringiensis]MEB4819479.1 DUF1653 domain-containing protein [Bacillus thuringiensis]